MLSREPPASSDHTIKTHGERNTPILRYKDPRNPPLSSIDTGETEAFRRSAAAMLDAGLHHRQTLGKTSELVVER